MDYTTLKQEIDRSLRRLDDLNPDASGKRAPAGRSGRLRKVLVANRGEIAKRFFLSLHEEGIPSAAVVTDPDRGQTWYEFADEVIFIGDQIGYADIPTVIGAALLASANAVYSGYGFLSENADFVEAIEETARDRGIEIIFMGPRHETIRLLGNKMSARRLARRHGIPLFESSDILAGSDLGAAALEASRIGYPVIIKPCSGAGGRGIIVARGEDDLAPAVEAATRMGRDLYGDPTFYIEQFIENPIHMEVQIFNGRAIGIRKCAVQRRNQKIIEESGHTFIDDAMSAELLSAAEKIAEASGYGKGGGAGTVEFLIDAESERFGFMEMNTRLQVEYAVTDQSLGIDIARWQILHFDGREQEIIGVDALRKRIAEKNHSIECRIYAEEPEHDYLPSPGTITELDLPTFNGIRCDFGFMEGDAVLPMYDPMMGKLIAHGATRREAIIRLERALQELYISGVRTNISQLLRIVRHERFIRGDYTNNLLNEYPVLGFREPEGGPGGDDPQGPGAHILFGAFAEHLRNLHAAAAEFMIIAARGSIFDIPPLAEVPYRYGLEHRGRRYPVAFIQTAMDTFHAFIGDVFIGTIILTSFNDRCDDLILTFGATSYRIRVNRHNHLIDLRMRDAHNKIDYFRMIITPDTHPADDAPVIIASPFQGTFVAFCRPIRAGDRILAGEPLLLLSSMKMETTITAAATGTVRHVIENGDASRLISHGAGGRVTGKSIQENEVLVIIEPDRSPGDDRKGETHSNGPVIDSLIRRHVGEENAADTRSLMELTLAAAQGFIYSRDLIAGLAVAVTNMPASPDGRMDAGDLTGILTAIIMHYTSIRKLFSPIVSNEGISFQEELEHFLSGRRAGQAAPSATFEELLRTLYASYGISRWEGKSAMSVMAHQYLFVLCRRSYQFSLEHTGVIQRIAHILSNIPDPGEEVIRALARLMEQEQSEKDDSLLKFLRKILASRYPDAVMNGFIERAAIHAPAGTPGVVEKADEKVLERCAHSLSAADNDESVALAEPLAGWTSGRILALARTHRARRLFWPSPVLAVYHLEPAEESGHASYIAFGTADFSGADPLDPTLAEASRALRIYRRIEPADTCWIHILATGIALSWCPDDDPSHMDHREFKGLCTGALDAIGRGERIRCIVDLDIFYPFSGGPRRRSVILRREAEAVTTDLLLPMDRRNPYHDPVLTGPANQRLIDADKWPIEAWANECFDPGTMKELLVPSIDNPPAGSSDTHSFAERPAGAKIICGEIGGAPACFFMKDSRVSGGSTGSREGLKYIAAAYLSYMNDWPLYVWNDSAGANIMEGIISLNRGAEGFMMNALLAERTDGRTFRRYVDNTADPDLTALIRELDREFGPFPCMPGGKHRNFQLTAVGTGSSAGLDVYGSSQASIQMLLDSRESYRVLTGSRVVHTVIGEEITNYDIGGAKILGKWTGIVDLVACDKLHLLASIFMAHRLFAADRPLPAIRRPRALPEQANESIVFSESTVRANVDDGLFWPFKESFYAADGLIGGFARMGGRRVLIMGPRTHAGLRSTAAVVKARELLRAARRTGSHRIMIFGRRWWQAPDFHENGQLRPHIDFLDELNRRRTITVMIVTHSEGMKSVEIAGAGDVVIYVRNGALQPGGSHAEKNTAFTACSRAEAFDLAHRIIELIDPVRVPVPFAEPYEFPAIPSDASLPYDIIESVITRAFDAGSFIEWYREMNNPVTGPNLITGLATLEGRTVGVIADQPLVQGGGADASGTEKFRVFTALLNRAGIPLVMLSNSSGFVPGSQQERFRIQAIGAESIDVNILGTIPVVSVVLNQNYGGRLIHAFNKFLRPGIVFLALEQAIMAVIGADAAFDLLFGKKHTRLVERDETEQAEELKKKFFADYLAKARAPRDGVASNLVDWVVPSVKDLRAHLIRGLELARRRCDDAFGTRAGDV